ncbi:MAG: response regulator transcription factor [Acidimicrobiales bacterium]|nr:response regulator transcription factor [Acidimicrobiales bacterium]MBO0893324.1 response regulator transcription factor [Acidimicrobiales bacterium]
MARILLVDDESLFAKATRLLLEQEFGHDVDTAQSVSEVLQLGGRSYDVALVDMILHRDRPGTGTQGSLSDGNGLDVLAHLSQAPHPPLFVLLTAGDSPRQHYMTTAFTNFPIAGALPKSADPATLKECLDAVLAGSEYIHPEIAPYRPAEDGDPSEQLLASDLDRAIWFALANGRTSHQAIAEHANYSRHTIENAIASIGSKLHRLGLSPKQSPKLADLIVYAAQHRDYFLWASRAEAHTGHDA